MARSGIALLALVLVLDGCGSRTPLGVGSSTTPDDASASDDGGSFDSGDEVDLDATFNPPDAAAVDATGRDVQVGDSSVGCENVTCTNGSCCAFGACIPIETQTLDHCGWDGVCAACPAGGRCFKGSCLTMVTSCSPMNCGGCCDSPNLCADGLSQRGCGAHGAACTSCFNTSTPKCNALPGGGGQCGTVAHCDPATCHGCCDGDACRLGNADGACGIAGEACHTCAAGETCVQFSSGGSCELPPLCTSTSCTNGCCDKNQCVRGDQDDACDTGRGVCIDCTARGEVCVNGQCVPGCSPSTCASGCCQGKVCAQGDQAFACGSGGTACVDCTQLHGSCANHRCR